MQMTCNGIFSTSKNTQSEWQTRMFLKLVICFHQVWKSATLTFFLPRVLQLVPNFVCFPSNQRSVSYQVQQPRTQNPVSQRYPTGITSVLHATQSWIRHAKYTHTIFEKLGSFLFAKISQLYRCMETKEN